MINRGDALNSDEWRNDPFEKQMGFKVPIGVSFMDYCGITTQQPGFQIMLDLTHLRKTHPIVTVEEYLLLHNISPSVEWSTGHWHTVNYHKTDPLPSLHVIPNGEYDPKPEVRVDRLPPGEAKGNDTTETSDALYERLGDQRTAMPISDAREVLKSRMNLTGVDDLAPILEEHGWTVLHTFRGS